MTQFKNIPQPGDNRNVSQNDILQNFLYVTNPLTGPIGGVNGILPVDHSATGDNVATPKDGFHNQVSYISQPIKNNTTNAVNGQVADGMTYVKPGAGNFPQELWYIFGNDNPHTNYKQVNLSLTKAVGYFNAGGGFVGTGAYNIFACAVNGSSVYTITFKNAMPDTNYIVLLSPENPVLCFGFVIAGAKAMANFDFAFFNFGGSRIQPTNFGVHVIENLT